MTDRELLKNAAKAAGYDYLWNIDSLLIRGLPGRWNPLTDDGDALRLAVKLGLTIDTSDEMPDDGNKDTPATRIDSSIGRMLLIEPHGADSYAATRRAIVRAAAEIGKGTKPFPTAKEIREEWT